MKERERIPSREFVDRICRLYGDCYDDRIENSAPPAAGNELRSPGTDWAPGKVAEHKSLEQFRRELSENGISLSSSKIRKILITGGCWTTERSRMIQGMYDRYCLDNERGGMGLTSAEAVERIAEELGVSRVTVSVNLPYHTVVYKLKDRSKNAVRCERYRSGHRDRNEVRNLTLYFDERNIYSKG